MQTFLDITGLDSTMVIAFPVGLIVLWIAAIFLWDRKLRPYRIKRGTPTATFNNILGRTLRFMFSEDKNPMIPAKKGKSGQPKPPGPAMTKVNKFLIWRNFNLLMALAGTVTALYGLTESLYVWGILLIMAGSRTFNIFTKRHQIFFRMFKVAASELRFARGSDMNPWAHVTVKKWSNLTQPGDTVVRFPPEFDTSSVQKKENFERHFNATVTEDNQWTYVWNGGQGTVECSPVDNLPVRSEYPGAGKNWNEFELGPNADGVAVWDPTKIPHALISGTSGAGKSLALTTPVLTARGMLTIGDLVVGDTVFDVDGNPTRVEHLHPVITPGSAYRIHFEGGESLVVDGGHLWETFASTDRTPSARAAWLDEQTVDQLKSQLAITGSDEVISVPQAAFLTGKNAKSKLLFQVAREVGIAEVHRPTTKFHYNAQTVVQHQTLLECDAEQFIAAYNDRRVLLSPRKPISRDQVVKLEELVDELRDTDSMSIDGLIDYVDATSMTASWIRSNFRADLDLRAAVADLSVQGRKVAYPFPAKIFSYSEKTIDVRQFADLIDVAYDRDTRALFNQVARKVANKRKVRREVELMVPEKTLERRGTPVNMYPKRMFLEHLLAHHDSPGKNFGRIRTTAELIDESGADLTHSVRISPAVEMEERVLGQDPRTVGLSRADLTEDYLTGSIAQRQELLSGILEADGNTSAEGRRRIASDSEKRTNDIVRLLSSLGHLALVESDGSVVLDDAASKRGILSIEAVEPEPMRCISVDSPSRLFQVGSSMITTHNSTVQRNIIFHCIQHSDHWAFLGIDVKMVELTPYVKYDTAVMGIADNVRDGLDVARYARDVMMQRYNDMKEIGVNDFRKLQPQPKALLLMVDEVFAFLSPSGNKTDEGKEIDDMKAEASLILGDIARLGRAAGVHLALATQRPDAKVIYGELKQNLAMRIAAGRMDSIASNMTLDNEAATLLPGDIKGRGYAQVNGIGQPFQGYYAAEDWIDKWLAGEHMAGAEELAAEEEAAGSKKRKKAKKSKGDLERKGGILGKIKAYNEKQYEEIENGEEVTPSEEMIDEDFSAAELGFEPEEEAEAAPEKKRVRPAAPAPVAPMIEDDDLLDLDLDSDHDRMRNVASSFQEFSVDDDEEEILLHEPAGSSAVPVKKKEEIEETSVFAADDDKFAEMFNSSPSGETEVLYTEDDLSFLDDDFFADDPLVGSDKKKPGNTGNVPPKVR